MRPTSDTRQIVISVAEEMKDDDEETLTYLRKLQRTAIDILAGRTVLPWRLERFQKFAEAISIESLREISHPGCDAATFEQRKQR